MPIIRHTSFGEQAGAAASAFEQTTAAQNQQRIAAAQLQQRRQVLQVQQARQAALDLERQEAREQATALQQARIEQDESQFRRSQMMRAARYGVPVSGASTLKMVQRLGQLDPEAYGASSDELDRLTGGRYIDSAPTAEDLDNDPALPAIFVSVAERLRAAEAQQGAINAQDSLEGAVEMLSGMDQQWLQTRDGQRIEGELALLAQSGDDPQDVLKSIRELELSATASESLYKDRIRWTQKAEELFEEFDVDEELKRQARVRQAAIMRANDPKATYLEVKARLDPDSRLIAEKAYNDGHSQGAAAEMAKRMMELAPWGLGRTASGQEEAPASPAATPGLQRALSPNPVRDAMREEGLDPSDKDARRAFIEEKRKTNPYWPEEPPREASDPFGLYDFTAASGKFIP